MLPTAGHGVSLHERCIHDLDRACRHAAHCRVVWLARRLLHVARPVAFLIGGLFFLLVAFAFSWMAATAISTGHAHLSHRGYGALDAWRDTEPMLFWLCIAMEYLSGLFICSYAIAVVASMDR